MDLKKLKRYTKCRFSVLGGRDPGFWEDSAKWEWTCILGGSPWLKFHRHTHRRTYTHTHTLIDSCGMYPLSGEVLPQISQLE